MGAPTGGAGRAASPARAVAVLAVSVVAVLAIGIGMAGATGSAPAQDPPAPSWSMPDDMVPGESGTVTGEGFQPGSTVVMSGPGNVRLGEAVADQFGRITMTMTVPMAMVSGPAMMTLVGTGIAGQVVTLEKSVNIGALIGAETAQPVVMAPPFTG